MTTGPELIHIEPNGEMWDLDIETAQPIWPELTAFYDGAICGGGAYIESHPPRRPFSLEGGVTIYVRPDTQVMPAACSFVSSYEMASGCFDLTNGTCLDGLLEVAQMTTTTAPVLPWVGPLHPGL